MDDLADLTAATAAALIRSGEITSEMLVAACLDRVRTREPEIGAWAWLDPDQAIAQARARDAWRATGAGTGPLHGVPVGIKDIIDTEDMPTENGTPIHRGRQPRDDAACVRALREAGAVIMGKTVTTELASLSPSPTRNPHDPSHTPGGSSAGSAASVAAGMVPVALGTQTAGSVIRPASFCGVFGLKPTHGLISRTGVTMQSHTLDTVGVMARSVDDLGLVLDCLSAHDPRDPASYPRSRASALAILSEDPPVPPTLAFCPTPAWDHAEAVTREAFAELVGLLGERCDEIDLPAPFDRIIAGQAIVQGAENAAWYGSLLDRSAGGLSAALRERLEAGARITAREYLETANLREVLLAGIDQVFERYDAILCPAASGPAPAGLETTGSPVFNGMWTWLGVPAVTLPLLQADGLPLGVQLVGPRRDDGRLLRTARWLVGHLSADSVAEAA